MGRLLLLLGKFEVINPTLNELNFQQLKHNNNIKSQLSTIPECAGIYFITFPNKKHLIGESINLRTAITKIVKELFPTRRKKIAQLNSYVSKTNWVELCLKENEGLRFEDLEIHYYLSPQASDRKKMLRVEPDERENFYNL